MTRNAAGLAPQMFETAGKHHMLVHVGEIAGMKRVLVIHGQHLQGFYAEVNGAASDSRRALACLSKVA